MELKEFLEDLNEILETEYGAIMQYILHSHQLSKSGYVDEANELLVLGNDEINHAEKLVEAIKFLGGKPTTKSKWSESAMEINGMLKTNLGSEKKSIEAYKRLIAIAEKEIYKGLVDLLKVQLADEIRHSQILEKFMKERELLD